MKKPTSTNIIFCSDVHLLNGRVRTIDICSRLLKLFLETMATEEIGYLVIAGDLFDAVGFFNDEDIVNVQSWMREVIGLCNLHNTALRVLEGTPSHDRNQSQAFITINDLLPHRERCNLLYIKNIDVIKETDGTTWLYVPDLSHRDPDDVLDIIHDRLHQEGIERVDFAVTHGMYTHHVGMGIEKKLHNPDAYLSLTRHYVANGHIHTSSIYRDRFLTMGSVDRLKHNEEEPKGIWLARSFLGNPALNELCFIENTDSEYMVTLDLQSMELEDAISHVEKHCHPTQRRFLRLEINETLFIEGILKHFANKYPNIRWDRKVYRDKKSDKDDLLTFSTMDDIIGIAPDTIEELLTKELKLEGLPDDKIKSVALTLKEVMEEAE